MRRAGYYQINIPIAQDYNQDAYLAQLTGLVSSLEYGVGWSELKYKKISRRKIQQVVLT